jgi:hypothetical protein
LTLAGDVVLTGIDGEVWPIRANRFLETYDILSDGQCQKKIIEVLVVHMDRPFQVMVSWQDSILQGYPGDWLVQYDEASYGIVGGSIFERTYDVLGPSDRPLNVGSPKIRISDQSTTP